MIAVQYMGHIAVQYMGQTKPYVEEWLKNSPLPPSPPCNTTHIWPQYLARKKREKIHRTEWMENSSPHPPPPTCQHQQVIATVHRLTKPYETVWLENSYPSCIKKLTYTNSTTRLLLAAVVLHRTVITNNTKQYHKQILTCRYCIALHCNYKQYHKKILTCWRCIASHCDYIYIDLHTHLMRAAWWRRIRGGHLQPLILPDVVEEQVIVQEHLERNHNLIQLCHGKLRLVRIIIIIIITQTEQTPRSLTFKN